MSWLSDDALDRLRTTLARPDLTGTRYRDPVLVARGGMGEVFRVRDESLGRDVALKVMHDLADEETAREMAARLTREAKTAAGLEHPAIVPVHEIGTLADGRVYYAMKLVEGRTLEEFAAGEAPAAERLRVFLRLCEAVAFAHERGVVHRDLKPANVMVGAFGEVLVMDWGIARPAGAAPGASAGAADDDDAGAGAPACPEPLTAHGAVLGTPGYMAPEQRRGEEVDRRADVFALGCVLAFLLAPDGARVRPRRLAAILEKARASEPEDRYPGARELAEDVARYLDDRPVAAYRERPWERIGRALQTHRFVVLLVVAYLALRAIILLASG